MRRLIKTTLFLGSCVFALAATTVYGQMKNPLMGA